MRRLLGYAMLVNVTVALSHSPGQGFVLGTMTYVGAHLLTTEPS